MSSIQMLELLVKSRDTFEFSYTERVCINELASIKSLSKNQAAAVEILYWRLKSGAKIVRQHHG